MSRPLPDPAFDAVAPWGRFAPSAVHRTLLAACHAVPQGLRRLVFALRRPIKYGVHAPLDVTIWGFKLRLLPRGNMSEIKLLFAPQLFDRDELALLRERLPPGGTFVDIGANAGVYSFWARRCIGDNGRVIAIEPDPEMRSRMGFNLAANGISNVTLVAAALSDREGEGELLINPTQRGENTLARDEAQRAGGDRVVHRVALRTLDALLREHGVARIDALKIDIEGHEPPVLRHFFAHAPAARWPALAITEYKPSTAQNLEALFAEHGYRRVLSNGLNLAFVRDGASAA